jgi:hypothetical protein
VRELPRHVIERVGKQLRKWAIIKRKGRWIYSLAISIHWVLKGNIALIVPFGDSWLVVKRNVRLYVRAPEDAQLPPYQCLFQVEAGDVVIDAELISDCLP